jgi:hypothetical protein
VVLMAVVAPPFPATGLVPGELTMAEYNAMISYMYRVDPKAQISIAATKKTFPFGDMVSEAGLISAYGWYVLHPGQKDPGGGTTIPHIPGTLPGSPNAPSIPNPIQGITDMGKAVVAIVKAILSAEFWLRAGEVTLGLILIAVGAAKLSGAASSVVKATPIGRLVK